jgi:hypothetical protein
VRGHGIATLTLLIGVLGMLLLPAHALAGGARKVPDLRRDAGAWVQPRAPRMLRLPVTVHLATERGQAVTTQADIAAWVERANEELAPYGIEVEVRAIKRMPAGWSSVTRWQARRALARYAPNDGSIHVFGISQLDEGARMGRRVRGLHWRYRGLARGLRGREYVIVTRDAPDTTLAHELGHLFGLRHTTRDDNIMCSCRRGRAVDFTTSQGQAMRDGARRFLARQGIPRGRVWADRH